MKQRESLIVAALMALILAGCGVGPIRQAKIGEKYVLEIWRPQWTGDGKSVVFDTDAWHRESRIALGPGGGGNAPTNPTRRREVMIVSVDDGKVRKLSDGYGCWVLPSRGLVAYLEPRTVPIGGTPPGIPAGKETRILWLHDPTSGERTSVCESVSAFTVSSDESLLSYRSEGREYLVFIDRPTEVVDLSEKMKAHAAPGYWSRQWTKDGQLFLRAQAEGAPKPTWYRFNPKNAAIERAGAPAASRIHDWDKEIVHWERQRGRPSPDGKRHVTVTRRSTETTEGTTRVKGQKVSVTLKAEIDNLVLSGPDGREMPLTDLPPPWR